MTITDPEGEIDPLVLGITITVNVGLAVHWAYKVSFEDPIVKETPGE
jgi:hypothetical protein